MNKIIIAIVAIMHLTLSVHGQQKLEREYDLHVDSVPYLALEFINTAQLKTKINWYYEENLKGNSIEAKFYYQDHKYSVEFDTVGRLQDIEIESLDRELDAALMDRLHINLSKQFKKYVIHKIQKQYSGTIPSLAHFLSSYPSMLGLQLKYEVIIKGKQVKRMKLYEVLFDHDGNVETIDEIILRNSDYLEY